MVCNDLSLYIEYICACIDHNCDQEIINEFLKIYFINVFLHILLYFSFTSLVIVNIPYLIHYCYLIDYFNTATPISVYLYKCQTRSKKVKMGFGLLARATNPPETQVVH